MAHKFVYIVSYTELVNGIVEAAGAFEESFKSAKTASKKMVANYNQTVREIKEFSCESREHFADPAKFCAEITEDEIDGEYLPALCVIRNWNGTDYDIYTWTVAKVYL